MAESLAVKLEHQLPGFRACFGGEELRRATSALAGGIDLPRTDWSKELEPTPTGSTSQPARSSHPGVASVLAQTAHPDASESDLHLRELALAANQYHKSEADAGPSGKDYDTLYHHGLVLQEIAAKLQSSSTDKQNLLQQACQLYAAAAAVRTSYSALYNWGVALSDMARLLGDSQPQESLSCLQQASHKYAASLDVQPGNPEALNNWGLVLQEMSSRAHSAQERDQLVSYALEKFRHAIRLRPDFDRGCYNLGTVLYTYACAVQAELNAELKVGRLTSPDEETSRERRQRESRARCLFTAAAQYICLATMLQPGKDIYRRSLAVVKPMLPLPFLRAGYLTAPLAHTLGGPSEMWRRAWFVLDHNSLRSASELESSLSTAASGALPTTLKIGHAVGEVPLVVPLDSILGVRRVYDPSLPEGEALWLQLSRPLDIDRGERSVVDSDDRTGSHRAGDTITTERSGSQGAPWAALSGGAVGGMVEERGARVLGAPAQLCVWLVADDADSADVWADALTLATHVVKSRSPGELEEALSPLAVMGAAAYAGGVHEGALRPSGEGTS